MLKLLLQEYQSYCDRVDNEFNKSKQSQVDEKMGDAIGDTGLTDDSDSSSDDDEDCYGGRNYVTVDEFFTGEHVIFN